MDRKKRIYTVATAHLDTIWSWDFESTVSKYIYDTLVDNIALFKKYPTYVFSFEGSYRYELMEEYYPQLFEEMREYVKQGRWNVAGSSFENGDVNCPSPEALFRNILIGNSYFYEKFGKRSKDIFLPDCFGFGWALPSIARHANLMGFTTQKLAWGSAYGIPFDIGKWYGVDDNYIYASVNPHDYYFTLTKLRDWDFVQKKLKENEKYGLDWTYIFHGIGDRGGAPKEATVRYVESETAKNPGSDIEVIAASADQIYRDIENELAQEVKDKLPEWKTELVMQNHGVGGYTSRAIGKRWNAKCQELADMAERAATAAAYLGAGAYNEDVLERSWKRAIAHQFHDDTPGTSVQRAYRRSWNDYAMSMNQFSGELEASLAGISGLMKSDFCTGTPVMVYNSVEADRVGAVTVCLKNTDSGYYRVYDDRGREVKSQCSDIGGGITQVLFIAETKSLGVRVYDIRRSSVPCPVKSSLSVSDAVLENQKYIVRLNKNGDIQSVIDKEDGERELLSKPIVLGLFNYNGSKDWPAWEMNFKEADKEPDRIPACVTVSVRENGPARVMLEVKQRDDRSEFTNLISLTDGGNTVDVCSEIEWQSLRTMCKNRFSFTAENEKASFDLGLGVIERGNMSEKLFEVPAQKWADITDKSGDFGISVISECKHGWDKFNDSTLRLTVLHTPKKNYRIDSMQSMMDFGLNRYSYALFSHKGRAGAPTQLEAKKFIQPLTAVVFDKHPGALGTDYSFGSLSTNDVILRAVKLPHHKIDSGEVIVRLNEGTGREVNEFTLTLGQGVESARELYASEEFISDARVENGSLVASFGAYEVKTFALRLKPSAVCGTPAQSSPVKLDYTQKNTHIPPRLMPEKINVFGTGFEMHSAFALCKGQQINISNGNSLRLLCASLNTDSDARFNVDGKDVIKKINSAVEAYAAWDLYDFKETAYVKDGHLGYEFTHSVDDNGNTLFAKGLYFWVVTLNGSEITLPDNPDIVILSAAQVSGSGASLVTPLYDSVKRREFTFAMTFIERLRYLHGKCVWMLNDKDNFIRHNNNGKNGVRKEQTRKNLRRH